MADITVELVSVERMLWSGSASIVTAQTTEGEIGVLSGHEPMLGQLRENGVAGTAAELVDTIEALGVDPADAATDYWRHAHNRIAAGLEPDAYEPAHHRAWLKRRGIAP